MSNACLLRNYIKEKKRVLSYDIKNFKKKINFGHAHQDIIYEL